MGAAAPAARQRRLRGPCWQLLCCLHTSVSLREPHIANTNALEGLTQALRKLPGVGAKSAARMAFHLLQHDKPAALQIARALERTLAYTGMYFVLMGKLSPLDGIGPNDIGLQKLFDRVVPKDERGQPLATEVREVQEVILATNFTAEGEATAHVIAQALKSRGVQVTRLARGVPVGSELEYVDLGTIAHALVDRR